MENTFKMTFEIYLYIMTASVVQWKSVNTCKNTSVMGYYLQYIYSFLLHCRRAKPSWRHWNGIYKRGGNSNGSRGGGWNYGDDPWPLIQAARQNGDLFCGPGHQNSLYHHEICHPSSTAIPNQKSNHSVLFRCTYDTNIRLISIILLKEMV